MNYPYPAVNIPSPENYTNKSWYKNIYIVVGVGCNFISPADFVINSIGLYNLVSIPVRTVSSNGSDRRSIVYTAYPRHRVSWNRALPKHVSAGDVIRYGLSSTTNYSGVMSTFSLRSDLFFPDRKSDVFVLCNSI